MNKLKRIIFGIFCMGLATSSFAEDLDRGIELKTFIPKGQWTVGSSVAYSSYDASNYHFLVVEGVTGNGYTMKLSPIVCYTVKDNLAIGGRFAYNRSLVKIDHLAVNIENDLNLNVDDVYSLSHSYAGKAVMRNYISLGNSKRFGLYNELQLSVGGSQSKAVNGKGESLTGTYSTSTDMSVSVAPGMVAFINNYTAVEVGVGIMGFNYSKTKQITNQIQVGEHSSSSGNFRINIFSISLGIAFYL